MMRRLVTAMILTVVLASAGFGQSITASATILERIDAGSMDVSVSSTGSMLSVRQEVAAEQGASLLRSTFVRAGRAPAGVESDGPAGVEPAGVREGSVLRLERRMRHTDGSTDGELRPGGRLLIDMVEQLTVTRVIAANS